MSDEIKEILDDIRFVSEEPSILEKVNETGEEYMTEYDNYVYLLHEQAKILYDYITNLQEENKHLDKVNCHLRKKINNDIYKSRIDKATKKVKDLYSYADNEEYVDNYCKDLLNILGGKNDN